MNKDVFWDTVFLRVYRDYSGDMVLHEKPSLSPDTFIFVNPKELEDFCRHYLEIVEQEKSADKL